MTSRLVAVALDCHDPEALAAFWCAALGYRVREWWSDAAGTGYVETGGDDGAALVFQPVREDKAVKNRLHLDVAPVQGSQADEVTRLVGLGASMLDDGCWPGSPSMRLLRVGRRRCRRCGAAPGTRRT